MAAATIDSITTATTNTEALSTNNTAFSLTTTANGSCVVVICITRSATVSIASLSGGGVGTWNQVGAYSFATNGSVPAQTFSVFAGTVTSFGSSQTVTATGSSSLSSISGTFAWQILTTTGMAARTSWVVEASGSSRNTTSSTDITMPTLVPGGASRAYIGYGDPVNTATNTGITAGYTGTIETTGSSALNQWISNLSVSTSQSPAGKQGTTGVSDAVGLLIYATNPDTTVATNLNIGTASGSNHFLLQTAFAGYSTINQLTQADIIAGWNTDPEFLAVTDSWGRPGVQMNVSVAAPTTDNSSFPRTELRELSTDGVTSMAFDPTSGVHYLRGRTKIGHLAATKPTLIMAQIHDGATGVGDLLAINTQLSGGRIQLQLRVNGSASQLPHPYLDIAPGDEFDWMIYIDTGNWSVFFNDFGTAYYTKAQFDALIAADVIAGTGRVDAFSWSGAAEYYFKAGCYSNSNTASESGDTTQFMQDELRYLQHWHTSWPTPSPAITLPQTSQFAPFFGG